MRFLVLLLLACLSGCTYFSKSKEEPEVHLEVEDLYMVARTQLDSGRYEEAINRYAELEARYPFGKYAQQSLLDMGYAHYKLEQADAAIAVAERFIRIYPRNPHVAYAYYLKGLANFNRHNNFLRRYLPVDEAQRDPINALRAFQDFSQLVTLFPESQYSADARQRMRYLKGNLAQNEVNVAHYYMRRGSFVAAANRARYAIEHYQGTAAIPDALALMAKAYKVLGMDELSQDALRVLRLNYPEHPAIDIVPGIVIHRKK